MIIKRVWYKKEGRYFGHTYKCTMILFLGIIPIFYRKEMVS